MVAEAVISLDDQSLSMSLPSDRPEERLVRPLRSAMGLSSQ
ncbi:hypothetical protein BH24ACT5_BH24ACT5_20640 [soil metagenome]